MKRIPIYLVLFILVGCGRGDDTPTPTLSPTVSNSTPIEVTQTTSSSTGIATATPGISSTAESTTTPASLSPGLASPTPNETATTQSTTPTGAASPTQGVSSPTAESTQSDLSETASPATPTAAVGVSHRYRDLDGDGYGAGEALSDDDPSQEVSTNHDDCDDLRSDIYPGAVEPSGTYTDLNCDNFVHFPVAVESGLNHQGLYIPTLGNFALHIYPNSIVLDDIQSVVTLSIGRADINDDQAVLDDLSALDLTRYSDIIAIDPPLEFKARMQAELTFPFDNTWLRDGTNSACNYIRVSHLDDATLLPSDELVLTDPCDVESQDMGYITAFLPHFSYYAVTGSTFVEFGPEPQLADETETSLIIPMVSGHPTDILWNYKLGYSFQSGRASSFKVNLAGRSIPGLVISQEVSEVPPYYSIQLTLTQANQNELPPQSPYEILVSSPAQTKFLVDGCLVFAEDGEGYVGKPMCSVDAVASVKKNTACVPDDSSTWGCCDFDGDGNAELFDCVLVDLQPDPDLIDDDGDGYSVSDGDCDDFDESIHPMAEEIPADEVDQNCDGIELCWADSEPDGYSSDNGPGSIPMISLDLVCGYYGDEAEPNLPSGDCDDNAVTVHPEAPEQCNGLDDDCDGLEDEGVVDTVYFDGDHDGFGGGAPSATCEAVAGYITQGGDCDDESGTTFPGAAPMDNPDACMKDSDGDDYGDEYVKSSVTPGSDCDDASVQDNKDATEIPNNGDDDDCDGVESCYVDTDDDNYGSSEMIDSDDLDCTDSHEAEEPGDANDTDPDTNPGAEEICDNKDNDQDGSTDEGCDDDNDNYCDRDLLIKGEPATCTMGGNDWNDTDGDINPGIDEMCDNKDNDQDGGADEGCDDDNDNYCDVTMEIKGTPSTCTKGGNDWDDTNAGTYPNAAEICDNNDNDQDGATDEGLSVDSDGDGHYTTSSCASPHDDCNDGDKTIYKDNPEVCDQKDNDCDGVKDDGLSTDSDGDGHYTTGSCATPNDDCHDGDPVIYSGRAEACDGKDNDCDGLKDEGLSADVDGDGHYTTSSCASPHDDCNDGDKTIYKDNPEVCDQKDNDCDGVKDDGLSTDSDGDGHYTTGSCATPNDDLNDTDPSIYPGAPDICDDKDNDNDGAFDEGVSVGSTWYTDLQAAINATSSGTITLCDSSVHSATGGYSVIGKTNLTITSQSGAKSNTARITNSSSSGIYISRCTGLVLRGLDISDNLNGEGSDGGGIKIGDGSLDGGFKRSSVTIERSYIQRNRAAGHGGGIYCNDCNLALTAVEIDDNNAGNHGSGIYVRDTSTINITEGSIKHHKDDPSSVVDDDDGNHGIHIQNDTNSDQSNGEDGRKIVVNISAGTYVTDNAPATVTFYTGQSATWNGNVAKTCKTTNGVGACQ